MGKGGKDWGRIGRRRLYTFTFAAASPGGFRSRDRLEAVGGAFEDRDGVSSDVGSGLFLFLRCWERQTELGLDGHLVLLVEVWMLVGMFLGRR